MRVFPKTKGVRNCSNLIFAFAEEKSTISGRQTGKDRKTNPAAKREEKEKEPATVAKRLKESKKKTDPKINFGQKIFPPFPLLFFRARKKHPKDNKTNPSLRLMLLSRRKTNGKQSDKKAQSSWLKRNSSRQTTLPCLKATAPGNSRKKINALPKTNPKTTSDKPKEAKIRLKRNSGKIIAASALFLPPWPKSKTAQEKKPANKKVKIIFKKIIPAFLILQGW